MQETNMVLEALDHRLARIGVTREISAERLATLQAAHDLGVNDEDLKLLCDADEIARGATIGLPQHRFALLSRGRGWCRWGRGNNVAWAQLGYYGDYQVSRPGVWTVGATDGFSRKGQDVYHIAHVQVGGHAWTICRNG